MIVEDSKGECNFGQHEINFRYAGALRTADEHAIFKNGAKEIASDEGMAMTFMAKYDEREGNSCHIHFSLADDSHGPLFDRDEALFDSFLAGQLACLRELTLLLAPNVNSYKRYAAASFAPTTVAWGKDNRTCSLRVVGHGPSKRFENRAGGADLNPYLALAAIIASGLHGVDAGLELEPPLEGNAYADEQRPRVPATLQQARDLFAGSEVAREAFGDEVVAHYLNAADVELAAFGSAGDRLGAIPGIRAVVRRGPRWPPLSAGAPPRPRSLRPRPSSRPSARRPPSRRPSTGSAPRSSSACWRPGAQLPAERELCARMGIARSTLRQALTALTQSGHVFATRGRGGGTFVSDPQPPANPPSKRMLAEWREVCDQRLAVELGVAVLAAERAPPEALTALDEVTAALDAALEDFAAYRQADIRLHVGLAEATGSARLVRAMTEVQGAMTDLIRYIAHPPEVLASSNAQHRRLLAALRERDAMRAAKVMAEHLRGTEHVLAGLLPGG